MSILIKLLGCVLKALTLRIKTSYSLPFSAFKPQGYAMGIKLAQFFIYTLVAVLAYRPAVATALKPSSGPIVSASLASDEILLALFPKAASEDNIVLSSFVDNPAYSSVTETAAKIPRRWHNSAEALIALKPKLVILASYNHPSYKIRLDQAAIPYIELKNFNRLTNIKDHIYMIGSAVGKEGEAKQLVESFQESIDTLAKENKKFARKPSLIAYSSMGTPGGKDTLIDDIIVQAGGENLAQKVGLIGWAKLNSEILAGMIPDFIILSDGGLTRAEAIKQISNDPSWKNFAAVKNQRFIFVNQAKLTSVSHHVLDAIKEIHQQLLEQLNAK